MSSQPIAFGMKMRADSVRSRPRYRDDTGLSHEVQLHFPLVVSASDRKRGILEVGEG